MGDAPQTPSIMKATLVLESSGPWCEVALVGNTAVHRHEDMTKGQAERLMGLVQDVLAEAAVTPQDLKLIVAGTGPGNFTGTRIAVSAARGMALGLGVPSAGVTMLEALAYGTQGPVITSVAAPREQVYVQGFGVELPAQLVPLADLPPLPQATCIGASAEVIAAHCRGDARPPTKQPLVAMAEIAQDKAPERPAPFYLRPADAAPASDPPPVILD